MAAKSQRGKPKIDVRLEKDTISKLEKIAAVKEKTVSYVVRQAIEKFLKEEQQNGENQDIHKEIRYPKAADGKTKK